MFSVNHRPHLVIPSISAQPQVPQAGHTLPGELQLARVLTAEPGHQGGDDGVGHVSDGVEVRFPRVVNQIGGPGLLLQLLPVLVLVLRGLHCRDPRPDSAAVSFRLYGSQETLLRHLCL